MRVTAVDAAPTQVIGEPGRCGFAHQHLQPAEMISIELLGRAEIHGHAVLNHAISFEDLIEDRLRASAPGHEFVRDDLEPINHGFAFENVPVMRNSQPDSDSVFGEAVEGICRHGEETRAGGAGPQEEYVTAGLFLLVHGSVGGATAFTFAGILALAAIVTARAAAVTFAGVLSLAGMFFNVGETRGRADNHGGCHAGAA